MCLKVDQTIRQNTDDGLGEPSGGREEGQILGDASRPLREESVY